MMTPTSACATLQVYGKSMNGVRSCTYRSPRVGPGAVQQVPHPRLVSQQPQPHRATYRAAGASAARSAAFSLALLVCATHR